MFCNKKLLAFLLATIVSSSLVMQQSVSILSAAYASESSPYDSGYDHRCDDAGRSESDKYINQGEEVTAMGEAASVDPTKAFPEVKISASDIMRVGTGDKYVAKSMIFFLNPVTI